MSFERQDRRAVAAAAIVAGVLGMVPLSGAAIEGTGTESEESFVEGGIDAAGIIRPGNIEGTLASMENMAEPSSCRLPSWFEEQIGVLEDARDVRANDAGSVVGFLVDSTAQQAFEAICKQMESRGWSRVSLGGVEGATFVREGESIGWTLVTCTQVGSATSVVFRSVSR